MSGTASRRPAARPPGRSAPRPRAPAKGRPTAPGAARAGRFAGLGRVLGRWGVAFGLGAGALVLLPVAHAFTGDLGVLLLGVGGIGFLLGRWSARFP